MSSTNGHPSPQRPSPGKVITRFFRSSKRASEEGGNSSIASPQLSQPPFPPAVRKTHPSPAVSQDIGLATESGRKSREKSGLWEWPTEDKNEPDTIYIIAVHGLQGDWERTWEQDGKIWLRDFIGKKIDRVQVLSFGYNSILASSGWTHELEHFSAQLLQLVMNHLDTEQKRSRPIIFLGHSLGGLIIKKALILAHNKKVAYSEILERTAGLIFMGTPHWESDATKWASIVKRSFNAVGVGSNTHVLDDLNRQSRTLGQINSDFVERGTNFQQILSFYELCTTGGLVIVDEMSATLGLPNERKIPLNADHRSMCRFASEHDQKFDAVWRPIRSMVASIRNKSLTDMKVKLSHIQTTFRGQNALHVGGPSTDLTQPTEGTCEWLCRTPMYCEWQNLTQKSCLLWISGGPGSGKTYLSNFIAKKLSNEHSGIVCKYSFSGDKTTPLGFLRSMLSQALAGNNHELCRYAIDNWDSAEWNLSWDSLWSSWAKTCEGMKAGQIFWVVDALDECDDPAMRSDLLKRMVQLLQKLNRMTDSGLCFRVFLTSRPEVWRELPPFADQESSILSRIILETESAIEDDIGSFIRSQVQMLAKEHIIKKKDIEKLHDLLCDGADRTFIWPQLTLQAIRNDPEACNEATWDQVLQAIPSNLEGIYEKLLSQLSGNVSRATTFKPLPLRTKKLLQFVLAGQGPLTVSELNILLVLGNNPQTISDAEKEAEDIGPIVEQVYGSFLRPVMDMEGVSHVRLFHDTARKHLLLPYSKSKYAMELLECHLELAKACISYLWLDDFSGVLAQTTTSTDKLELLNQHPLLHYASLNWAHHVRESEGLMDEDLLERVLRMYKTPSKRYQNWTRAYWNFSVHGIGGTTTTPFQMCARNGHCRTLKQLLQDFEAADLQDEIDQKDTAGNTALHYAVDSGRPEVIETLLFFKADSRIRNNSGLAALHKAVIANEEQTVLALLSSGGNVDIRTDGEKPGRTVLHLAAETGLESMVKLLVKHGANIQILDSTSSTPAKIAFERGHGAISQFLDSEKLDSGITDLDRAIIDGDENRVRELVEGGASVSSTDNRGSTPLHRAARGGIIAIMRSVLAKNSSTDIQDDDGMTPLHVAVRYGHMAAMELLLAKNAQVNAQSADKLTPLHEGVLSGKVSVVDRLLDAGADQFNADRNGLTSLFTASSLGYDAIVELLLRKDKLIGLKRSDIGRLPIHVAAKNGHLASVRALLKQDSCTIETEDREGCTPLNLAACGDSKMHAETAKFLIESGAILGHKTLNGATPLLVAAQNGNELTIRYLFGEGCAIISGEKVDLDERSPGRLTPLLLAAVAGHESVVLLLLRHWAKDLGGTVGTRDLLSWVAGHGMTEALKLLLKIPEILVDSTDNSIRTPLSWAAGNGHSEVVIQLLDTSRQAASGINVDFVDTENRTPLSWAAAAGHQAVVKVLLEYGADPTIKCLSLGSPVVWAVTEGHDKVFTALVQSGKVQEEDMFDISGNTLLSLAAENGKSEILPKLLLDHSSAAVNNPNRPKKTTRWTPLMLAARNGHEEIVRILLGHGANVHMTTLGTKSTALILAIDNGYWSIVDMLVKHDPTALQANMHDGTTPLYLAVQNGDHEMVQLLLASGCDTNVIASRSGNTLLHAVSEQGHFLVLKPVLEVTGHHLTTENMSHYTPLMLAAFSGHERVFTMLLDYAREKGIEKADLVKITPGGDSVLAAAVNGGNPAIVRLIREQFRDQDYMLKSKDRTGWTPLTLATKSGNTEMIRQLLNEKNVNEPDPETGQGPLTTCFMFWRRRDCPSSFDPARPERLAESICKRQHGV